MIVGASGGRHTATVFRANCGMASDSELELRLSTPRGQGQADSSASRREGLRARASKAPEPPPSGELAMAAARKFLQGAFSGVRQAAHAYGVRHSHVQFYVGKWKGAAVEDAILVLRDRERQASQEAAVAQTNQHSSIFGLGCRCARCIGCWPVARGGPVHAEPRAKKVASARGGAAREERCIVSAGSSEHQSMICMGQMRPQCTSFTPRCSTITPIPTMTLHHLGGVDTSLRR